MAENPADMVVAGVERCLEYAATWHAWDGRPADVSRWRALSLRRRQDRLQF